MFENLCYSCLLDIEMIKFGGLNFTTISTPGHTSGHICYMLDGKSLGAPDCLFTGDHLFVGGCGRLYDTFTFIMNYEIKKYSCFRVLFLNIIWVRF